MDNCLKMKDDFSQSQIVSCPYCHRANQKFARFCGGCGKPVKLNASPESRPAKLGTILKRIYNRSFSHKTVAASLIGISMLGLTLFGINSLSAIQTSTNPNWIQLRRHFSKSFRLTNNELDMLYAKVLNSSPQPSQKVDANDLLALEALMQKRLRNNQLRIFPNPFFSKPDRILRSPKEIDQGFIYSDIALNHPAYKALKALHDIGITGTEQGNELRPYDKVTQLEWQKTLNSLFARLDLTPVDNNYAGGKHGINNFELNESFAILRKRFALQPKETFSWASDAYYPSRLEAFAALSSLLQELY